MSYFDVHSLLSHCITCAFLCIDGCVSFQPSLIFTFSFLSAPPCLPLRNFWSTTAKPFIASPPFSTILKQFPTLNILQLSRAKSFRLSLRLLSLILPLPCCLSLLLSAARATLQFLSHISLFKQISRSRHHSLLLSCLHHFTLLPQFFFSLSLAPPPHGCVR